MIDELERSVGELLGSGDWRLTQAAGGSRGVSWVARGGGRQLLVKVGADGSLLRRLGQLGVAPPVVASQQLAGGDLVIQEFVRGVHPDEQWVDSNVAAVSRLMNIYHADVAIREGVAVLSALTQSAAYGNE